MYRGEVFRDVTVAPGEVKDLGDLKVDPAQAGQLRGCTKSHFYLGSRRRSIRWIMPM